MRVELTAHAAQPVEGCELHPYVHHSSKGTVDHRWFRAIEEKCVISGAPAQIQFMPLARLVAEGRAPKGALAESFFASTELMVRSWQALRKRTLEFSKNANPRATSANPFQTDSKAAHTSKPVGLKWVEVGQTKDYTPTVNDVGHALKLVCSCGQTPADHESALLVTPPCLAFPSRPAFVDRCMLASGEGTRLQPFRVHQRAGALRVLTYNVLAELYSIGEVADKKYRSTPRWALSWAFRRRLLVQEILHYRADVICLQEGTSKQYISCLPSERSRTSNWIVLQYNAIITTIGSNRC